MLSPSDKQAALQAIDGLPDNASLEDIMYRLYVLQKVQAGEQAADRGATITLTDLQKNIQTW